MIEPRKVMTGKERVIGAINHRDADRVPTTFDAESEVYALLYKHFSLRSKEKLFDRLCVDTWMILPNGFEGTPTGTPGEKESIWGCRTVEARYAGGAYDELSYWPLAGRDSLDDIEKWNAPTLDQIDFSHFPKEAKEHQDRAVIGVFTHGPYFIATDLRSLEDLMVDFALNRAYAHRLIDKISERSLAYLQNMLENYGEGIDIVYMADDYCSQRAPLFSPPDFREFVMPYLTAIAQKVHEHGKVFLLHCCGAVRPFLPMIIEAGVDMLEPIQIRSQGMEPLALKRDFGKDLCFYGGLDLQEVLCRASRAQVREEAKRLIDILGRDGGYVFGPGHTYIQMDAPVENIIAMYDTAATYRSSVS